MILISSHSSSIITIQPAEASKRKLSTVNRIVASLTDKHGKLLSSPISVFFNTFLRLDILTLFICFKWHMYETRTVEKVRGFPFFPLKVTLSHCCSPLTRGQCALTYGRQHSCFPVTSLYNFGLHQMSHLYHLWPLIWQSSAWKWADCRGSEIMDQTDITSQQAVKNISFHFSPLQKDLKHISNSNLS